MCARWDSCFFDDCAVWPVCNTARPHRGANLAVPQPAPAPAVAPGPVDKAAERVDAVYEAIRAAVAAGPSCRGYRRLYRVLTGQRALKVVDPLLARPAGSALPYSD